MLEFWISTAFAVMFQVVKNATHVSQFKAALRKLRDILNNLPLE
jgi:hypothetical protein